jgi:hypothetical protein
VYRCTYADNAAWRCDPGNHSLLLLGDGDAVEREPCAFTKCTNTDYYPGGNAAKYHHSDPHAASRHFHSDTNIDQYLYVYSNCYLCAAAHPHIVTLTFSHTIANQHSNSFAY